MGVRACKRFQPYESLPDRCSHCGRSLKAHQRHRTKQRQVKAPSDWWGRAVLERDPALRARLAGMLIQESK